MGSTGSADLKAVNLGLAEAEGLAGLAARSRRHLGPQESGELSGDRGRHDALDVLACGQRAEPGAQALLGCPRVGYVNPDVVCELRVRTRPGSIG